MQKQSVDLAGVSFSNRQKLYKKFAQSDEKSVLVVRRKDNPGDYNAIEILTFMGESLGYFPRTVAAEYAPLIDRGLQLPVVFKDFYNNGSWKHMVVEVSQIPIFVINALPKVNLNPLVSQKPIAISNEHKIQFIEIANMQIRNAFDAISSAQKMIEKLSEP